jgi:hypothetical protein
MLDKSISDLALPLSAFILTPITIIGVVVVFIAQPQVGLSRLGERANSEGVTFHD